MLNPFWQRRDEGFEFGLKQIEPAGGRGGSRDCLDRDRGRSAGASR